MDDQTAVVQLLEQAAAILDLRRKRPPVPGENFNIFSVMNMETKEVDTHCRLLYDLLSPNGSHGMGDCFLEAFFLLVIKKPYPGSAAVSICREYVIDHTDDNYGRIDLLLQGENFCYPIEVKIYAGDQWEQVKRYARFSSGARDGQVYYLTPNGSAPTEESLGGTDLSDVVCLPFADDIRRWLKRCGELTWNVPNVAEIIRQYIKLLDKLTGNYEGDVFMEQVKKAIAISRTSFESALAIAKSLDDVKTDTLIRVFDEIERHMKGLDPSLEKLGADYKEKAQSFCRNARGGAYPSLTYRLATCGEFTLALRFEVEYNFYFGVTFFRGEQVQCPKDLHQLIDAFSDSTWKDYIDKAKPMSDWWLWWKYLPYADATGNDRDKLLNFKECSGLYTQLYDPDQRKALMDSIFNQIDSHIDNIRNTGLF